MLLAAELQSIYVRRNGRIDLPPSNGRYSHILPLRGNLQLHWNFCSIARKGHMDSMTSTASEFIAQMRVFYLQNLLFIIPCRISGRSRRISFRYFLQMCMSLKVHEWISVPWKGHQSLKCSDFLSSSSISAASLLQTNKRLKNAVLFSALHQVHSIYLSNLDWHCIEIRYRCEYACVMGSWFWLNVYEHFEHNHIKTEHILYQQFWNFKFPAVGIFHQTPATVLPVVAFPVTHLKIHKAWVSAMF